MASPMNGRSGPSLPGGPTRLGVQHAAPPHDRLEPLVAIRPVSALLLRYAFDHLAITVQQYGATYLFTPLKLKSPFFRQMDQPPIEAVSPVKK